MDVVYIEFTSKVNRRAVPCDSRIKQNQLPKGSRIIAKCDFCIVSNRNQTGGDVANWKSNLYSSTESEHDPVPNRNKSPRSFALATLASLVGS